MDQDKEEHIHIFGPYGCWCGEKLPPIKQSYRLAIATVLVVVLILYALYKFN